MSNEESNSLPSALEARAEDEPPAKMRKVSSPKPRSPATEADGDGETCPICLDPWDTSGDHRLVALKCGHLFGLRCVQRRLQAQPQTELRCPFCRSKASMRDFRPIYARRVVAVDISEITNMQKQVEQVKAEKSRVELELQAKPTATAKLAPSA